MKQVMEMELEYKTNCNLWDQYESHVNHHYDDFDNIVG
jgi:hypothetical protein